MTQEQAASADVIPGTEVQYRKVRELLLAYRIAEEEAEAAPGPDAEEDAYQRRDDAALDLVEPIEELDSLLRAGGPFPHEWADAKRRPLFVATLHADDFLFTTAGATKEQALELMRQAWARFRADTVDGDTRRDFEELADELEIRELRPGVALRE